MEKENEMTEQAEYKVDGMTCGGCVASVTRALEKALPSVKIEVELEPGTARIEGSHEASAVERAIEDAGFEFGGAC